MDKTTQDWLEKYFNSRLDGLTALVESRFDAIEKKINRIDEIQGTVDDMKDSIGNSIDKLDKRTTEIETKMRVIWGTAIFLVTTGGGTLLAAYINGWF